MCIRDSYEFECGNPTFCHPGPEKNDTECDLSRAACAPIEAALLADFFQTISTALHAKGKTIGSATNSVTGAGFEHWQYYQSYLNGEFTCSSWLVVCGCNLTVCVTHSWC